jgi:hypothetical protein
MNAQTACTMVKRYYDTFMTQAQLILGTVPAYLTVAIGAIGVAAKAADTTFDVAEGLLDGLPDPPSLDAALQADLTGPDFDEVFSKCPFLAELLSPVSNLQLSAGAAISISPNLSLPLDDIREKYLGMINDARNAVQSVLDPLLENALWSLYQYEKFLEKSGVFTLLATVGQIEACLENLCEVVLNPEDKLLPKFQLQAKVSTNGLLIGDIAAEANVDGNSLQSSYSMYKQKIEPPIVSNAESGLATIKNQFSNFSSMF